MNKIDELAVMLAKNGLGIPQAQNPRKSGDKRSEPKRPLAGAKKKELNMSSPNQPQQHQQQQPPAVDPTAGTAPTPTAAPGAASVSVGAPMGQSLGRTAAETAIQCGIVGVACVGVYAGCLGVRRLIVGA